jgi:hypothetical protein
MLSWEIINAEFNPNYSIDVEFADGFKGKA